jgi:hypothetical protein
MPRYYVRTGFGFGWWICLWCCLYLALFAFQEAAVIIPIAVVLVAVVMIFWIGSKAVR